ncbi:hypothetical protein HS1genome_0162 [Sulfodiicoccus acidiphilus]|uniref:Uncharacterized protein n=1 Tax=Sulfodiicoccus acidiphilus TaxID=1670455 RepID=A0A348B0S1_9CREN|nr:hypothetical protein [Sulfodiicoccus acidiphilus]BBD71773.1 hypothetical protein HS1genome_0162 [Sulfodiicoccus acidiphilus]GGT99122.1 hypothetical protein GCM10007116_15560 [Sulfodiicoccus acidiphilus]
MLSWIVGTKFSSWSEMSDIFADYRNAAVYVDSEDIIQMIKVGEFDDFYTQYSVLLSPSYLKRLRVRYLKMMTYAAFPVFDQEIYESMVYLPKVKGRASYGKVGFEGGWIVYPCEGCQEAQRLHLELHLSAEKQLEILMLHLRR